MTEIGMLETTTEMLNMTNTGGPMIPQRSQLQVILGYVLTVTIAIVMIGMGCGVEFQKMKAYILKPTGVIIGLLCQFVLMPVLAFALAKILQMEEVEAIALLLVGSCPGGTTSNIATYWIEGDMDLSITMTAVSTTLALGVMPLLLYIYSLGFGNDFEVPYDTIGIALAALVIPITLGMIIRVKKPKLAEIILKVLSSVGGLAVMGIIIAILVAYGKDITISNKQLIAAALFPGIGLICGYGVSSLVSLINPLYLEHRQRRTICIETGVQNTQLAGGIIQLSFNFLQIIRMILFPVAYFLSQLVWLAILIIGARIYFWKYETVEESDSTFSGKDKKSSYSSESTNKAYVDFPESKYIRTTM